MEITKQHQKNIKKDLDETTGLKTYYYIVYAFNDKEADNIISKGIYAVTGELK